MLDWNIFWDTPKKSGRIYFVNANLEKTYKNAIFVVDKTVPVGRLNILRRDQRIIQRNIDQISELLSTDFVQYKYLFQTFNFKDPWAVILLYILYSKEIISLRSSKDILFYLNLYRHLGP